MSIAVRAPMALKRPKRPKGPKGHWVAGNLPEFRDGRLDFLMHCARTYGDAVPLRFAHRRIMLLNHPDLIEEILVTKAANFTKHWGLRSAQRLLGNGLLTSEGEFWRRQRDYAAV